MQATSNNIPVMPSGKLHLCVRMCVVCVCVCCIQPPHFVKQHISVLFHRCTIAKTLYQLHNCTYPNKVAKERIVISIAQGSLVVVCLHQRMLVTLSAHPGSKCFEYDLKCMLNHNTHSNTPHSNTFTQTHSLKHTTLKHIHSNTSHSNTFTQTHHMKSTAAPKHQCPFTHFCLHISFSHHHTFSAAQGLTQQHFYQVHDLPPCGGRV